MSSKRRYPTDLTDRQWSIVESLLSSDPPHAPGGHPLIHDRHEIVNAILY
jgi:transposase